MKKFRKYLAALFCMVALVVCAAPKSVTLEWDFPAGATASDIQAFRVYHSVDMVTWELMGTVPGSQLKYVLSIEPGRHFFHVTSVNFWGESDRSNVASTPLPVGSPSNTRIRLSTPE